jgi:uncharacterized protein involved in exopolysaccharide biosynthesis
MNSNQLLSALVGMVAGLIVLAALLWIWEKFHGRR